MNVFSETIAFCFHAIAVKVIVFDFLSHKIGLCLVDAVHPPDVFLYDEINDGFVHLIAQTTPFVSFLPGLVAKKISAFLLHVLLPRNF